MTTPIRSLCVLCGSREGINTAYRTAAARLGTILAQRGVRLVYGGGSIGLMGVIADAVLAGGGDVVGIIPEFLLKYEVGHRQLSELVVTDSMQDRKRRMFEMSDGFAVLPGGLGTLDEAFEYITWKQLRLHSAPIVVLDIDDYWAPFKSIVDAVVAGGFAHPAVNELYTVVTSPEHVLPALESAPHPQDVVLTSHL
ncbi:MAG: TIGR00730 family Rossman fold protein [Rhodospirillales bacterium]|nr:TIGR00730 family Rossman fold protein [Rhodospirillales bacterium]